MSADLPAEADRLFEIIGHFTEAVRNDENVLLDGLQEEIARFCLAVMELPPESARTFAPVLEDLNGAIDELRAELEKAQSRVQREIEGLSGVQKAHTAYRTSDGMGGPRPAKPEEE